MLTALKSLHVTLLATLKSLTAFFDVVPYFLLWLSSNKIDKINDEILRLESDGDPKHRDRLGQLRVQKADAGKFHAALLSRFAPPQSGDKTANH